MRCRKVAILVLDQVQMLDQQIATPGPVAQKRLNLGQGLVVQLPALGRVTPLAAAGFPDPRLAASFLVERAHAFLRANTTASGIPEAAYSIAVG